MMNREEPDEGSGTMFRHWLSQQATNQFREGIMRPRRMGTPTLTIVLRSISEFSLIYPLFSLVSEERVDVLNYNGSGIGTYGGIGGGGGDLEFLRWRRRRAMQNAKGVPVVIKSYGYPHFFYAAPRKELQMFNNFAIDAIKRSLVADKEKK
ncbi:hypothetical protein Tco_0944694 [Tanacetum coccineum]